MEEDSNRALQSFGDQISDNSSRDGTIQYDRSGRRRLKCGGDGDVVNGPIISGEVAGRIRSTPTVEMLIEEIVSEADKTLRILSDSYLGAFIG